MVGAALKCFNSVVRTRGVCGQMNDSQTKARTYRTVVTLIKFDNRQLDFHACEASSKSHREASWLACLNQNRRKVLARCTALTL